MACDAVGRDIAVIVEPNGKGRSVAEFPRTLAMQRSMFDCWRNLAAPIVAGYLSPKTFGAPLAEATPAVPHRMGLDEE